MIAARMLTQEQDGIPGYMAHPEGAGARPGVLMVHHAHGVTADYKIDAYRLAQLGFNAQNLAIGGVSLLIVVTVGLEALRQINSRALMVTYDEY
jgi:hypothetical protein